MEKAQREAIKKTLTPKQQEKWHQLMEQLKEDGRQFITFKEMLEAAAEARRTVK